MTVPRNRSGTRLGYGPNAPIVLGMLAAALWGAPATEAKMRNGLIAYTKETNRCGDLGCESYVWTTRADGRAQRRLPCSTAQPRRLGCVDVLPDFAPDGRLLATATGGVSDFTERGQPKDIVAIRRRRGNVVTRIPQFGRQIVALAWSPNGERLAVGTDRAIYIIARDGTDETLFRRTRVRISIGRLGAGSRGQPSSVRSCSSPTTLGLVFGGCRRRRGVWLGERAGSGWHMSPRGTGSRQLARTVAAAEWSRGAAPETRSIWGAVSLGRPTAASFCARRPLSLTA